MKQRFSEPNYTQSPNVFYDEILRDIDTLAELKVTDTIIRHTFGFHRDAARLTFDDFEALTGLKRGAVRSGIARALKRKTIERAPDSGSYRYRLAVGTSNHEQFDLQTASGLKVKPRTVGTSNRLYKEVVKEKNKEIAAAAKEPNIFTIYQHEIGALTPLIADDLKDIEQTYPEGWFEDAVKEAVQYNARNLAYIHKILARWKAQGKGPKKNSNGKPAEDPDDWSELSAYVMEKKEREKSNVKAA